MGSSRDEIRAFVAVNLPPGIREVAGRLIETGRGSLPGVRWVDPALAHLTVKFLGAITADRVTGIGERLGEAGRLTGTFPVCIKGVSAFPDHRRPRVIAVGMSRGREALVELISLVEEELAKLGIPRDGREPDPHLTLGRFKAPAEPGSWRVWLEAHRDDELGEFIVRELSLMKSTLGPGGPRYEVLGTFPLTAATTAR